jgi:hypothetical protein
MQKKIHHECQTNQGLWLVSFYFYRKIALALQRIYIIKCFYGSKYDKEENKKKDNA